MRLTLAVPDLLTQDRNALAALPSLATLAQLSDAPAVRQGALDDFLMNPIAAPNAAVAALGAGHDAGTHYVLRADPVSLVAGRNDVALSRRIDDLDRDASGALIATLNAHFGGDGLAFLAPRPDAWFIEVDRTQDMVTTQLSAVRDTIYPHLPAGPDAPRWRRWMSEMQMLLHDHPANTGRITRGLVPVTGIWISAGGRLADIPIQATSPARTFAADDAGGDVARGMARLRGARVEPLPLSFTALPEARNAVETNAVIVLPRGEAVKLSELDRDWLAPAIAALTGRTLEGMTLLADGNGVAAAWHARRPAWTRRALAWISTPRFVPPAPLGDDA